jgi:hypothetical protein
MAEPEERKLSWDFEIDISNSFSVSQDNQPTGQE